MTTTYNKQVLLKRGNTAVSSAYTGPVGEVTVDTDLDTIRVHDGITPGGHLASSSYMGPTPPVSPRENTLWYDEISGRLYIRYSGAWVDASPAGDLLLNANVISLASNVANVEAHITSLDANIGSFETVTNNRVQLLSANIGTFETETNNRVQLLSANIGTFETSVTGTVNTINANINTLNSTVAGFEANAGPTSSAWTSNNPPNISNVGALWYDDVGGRLYVRYDGSWVDASPMVTNEVSIMSLNEVGAGTSNSLVNNGYTFSLENTGHVTLSNGSILEDNDSSLNLVIDHPSTGTAWYNIFGDIGCIYNTLSTINGSVCYDTNGNVYVVGSTDFSPGDDRSVNLFLKYDINGKLIWRRTWTDNIGLPCGSYNASMRYVAANVTLGTQDTILWSSYVPDRIISYVGTMDTEGNFVDEFGIPRTPTKLDNVRITDIEWSTNSNANIFAVGMQYNPASDQYVPLTFGVNLNTTALWRTGQIIKPNGISLTNSDPKNNNFKATVLLPISGMFKTAQIGTYSDGTHSHAILNISNGASTTTFEIGSNYSNENILGEDICCDTGGNVYIVVNNSSNGYAVLAKSNLTSFNWKFKFGAGLNFYATAVAYNNGSVYMLGTISIGGDDDMMLIKINSANGNVEWQRRIGSLAHDTSISGRPGWESSSGISVQDNKIAISFATQIVNNNQINTVTLQYPTDGSWVGTFGDFTISDFDIDKTTSDYDLIASAAIIEPKTVTASVANLTATSTLVTEAGYNNLHWSLDENRRVYAQSKWSFDEDGSTRFPGGVITQSIGNYNDIVICANITNNNADRAQWQFNTDGNLTLPAGGNLVTSTGSLHTISLDLLKSIVANSTGWSEFQANIAAL